MYAMEGLVLTAGNLSSWWEEINESRQWQDGSFYFLCASYALVASVALVQLIRIQLRVPEYAWTTQKVFHFMNFLVNGVRAVVFGFHTQVFLLRTKARSFSWFCLKCHQQGIAQLTIMLWASCCVLTDMSLYLHWWNNVKIFTLALLDLPGLLFFSTYTLLVLFWAEIYRQAKNLPTGKLKMVYICINILIYAIQVCIWIYLWINDNSIVELVVKLFIVAVSFVAALGFVLYGGRLFFMLRRFPIESKGRRKKLHEVGSVTAICFACFLIRLVMVGLSAFNKNASLDVLDHPILDLIYYMLTEILPSALVLYILRKLPPKRLSAHYHPIR